MKLLRRTKKTESEENAMNEKVVEVTMGSRKVGRIALDRERRALFEYDLEWIRNGFSIS